MQTNENIPEDFLHYLWQYQLYDKTDLTTVDGDPLTVLFPGYHNRDAGPDFKQAVVQIGDIKWAGNVEIHVRSSDWFRHLHQYDAKYRSVTLHVVCFHDAQVQRDKGESFPTLELQHRIPDMLWQRYRQLVGSDELLPCRGQLASLNALTIRNLSSSLAMERLLRKQEEVQKVLSRCAGDWDETCYRALAVGFGFKTNSTAFELLAQSLPHKLIARHADSELQVEALVFGQSGMLRYPSLDDYYDQLKYEYDYLQYKYQLSPIEHHHWNLLRMRPQNFPCTRLAQFAKVLTVMPALMEQMLNAPDLETLHSKMSVTANPYWRTHYHFGCDTILEHSVAVGESAVNLLILNTVIPVRFAFHQFSAAEEALEQDVAWLERLPFERNRVTKIFADTCFPKQNAQDSQALLELHGQYCRNRRCLECTVGDGLVRRQHAPPPTS